MVVFLYFLIEQLNSMITLVFMTLVGCVTTDVMW